MEKNLARSAGFRAVSKFLLFSLLINLPAGINSQAFAEESLQGQGVSENVRAIPMEAQPASHTITMQTASVRPTSIESIMSADKALSINKKREEQHRVQEIQKRQMEQQIKANIQVRESATVRVNTVLENTASKTEVLVERMKDQAKQAQEKIQNKTQALVEALKIYANNQSKPEPIVSILPVAETPLQKIDDGGVIFTPPSEKPETPKAPEEPKVNPQGEDPSTRGQLYIGGVVIYNNHHTPSTVMHGEVLIETATDGRYYVKFEDEEALKLVAGTYVKAILYEPAYQLEGAKIYRGKLVAAEYPKQDPGTRELKFETMMNFDRGFRGQRPSGIFRAADHAALVDLLTADSSDGKTEKLSILGPYAAIDRKLEPEKQALVIAHDGNLPEGMKGSAVSVRVASVKIETNAHGQLVLKVIAKVLVDQLGAYFAKSMPVTVISTQGIPAGLSMEVEYEYGVEN